MRVRTLCWNERKEGGSEEGGKSKDWMLIAPAGRNVGRWELVNFG
jgi:hypothetical protein